MGVMIVVGVALKNIFRPAERNIENVVRLPMLAFERGR